ncbi:hypothetical protein GGQ85_003320 [Nitrobacter vulgaris]|uniref:hypothetical protein n=1 Tax=Nitrobacter vulgaris TaxID=29421 RepID=UPI0028671255|nr:hypothetical protein [Nitrobacter vulgaris]MDR6305596.1 hypothetical protein [Nitrobacter vulgaris]
MVSITTHYATYRDEADAILVARRLFAFAILAAEPEDFMGAILRIFSFIDVERDFLFAAAAAFAEARAASASRLAFLTIPLIAGASDTETATSD